MIVGLGISIKTWDECFNDSLIFVGFLLFYFNWDRTDMLTSVAGIQHNDYIYIYIYIYIYLIHIYILTHRETNLTIFHWHQMKIHKISSALF